MNAHALSAGSRSACSVRSSRDACSKRPFGSFRNDRTPRTAASAWGSSLRLRTTTDPVTGLSVCSVSCASRQLRHNWLVEVSLAVSGTRAEPALWIVGRLEVCLGLVFRGTERLRVLGLYPDEPASTRVRESHERIE